MPTNDLLEAFQAIASSQSFNANGVETSTPAGAVQFILHGKALWLPTDQVRLVAQLPDLDPPSGDWDQTIHYRLYELYLLTPPGRPGLYVHREIDHYPEEFEQYETHRVVSEQEAAELCHAANVIPDGPLGRLMGRVAEAGLDAVYADNQDKLASANAETWRPEELTPRRFTFRGVTVEWGKSATRYKLVRALWNADRHQPSAPREKAEVSATVYPRESDTRAKLKDLVKQVRTMFADAGMPLKLRDEGGLLSLEETPG